MEHTKFLIFRAFLWSFWHLSTYLSDIATSSMWKSVIVVCGSAFTLISVISMITTLTIKLGCAITLEISSSLFSSWWPTLVPFGVYWGIFPLLKSLFETVHLTWCCEFSFLCLYLYVVTLGVVLVNPSGSSSILQRASWNVSGFGLLLVSVLNTMLSDLYVMCASIEQLIACGNSDVNSTIKIPALTIAISMSSISSNWDFLFGGNDSLKKSTHLTYLLFSLIPF